MLQPEAVSCAVRSRRLSGNEAALDHDGGRTHAHGDLVFVRPWGFDLAAIRVPVLLLQGEQDKYVPYGHGGWLSEHIPGVEAWLTAEDGHLTLAEHRVPKAHEWLLARYAPNDATDA